MNEITPIKNSSPINKYAMDVATRNYKICGKQLDNNDSITILKSELYSIVNEIELIQKKLINLIKE